MLKSAFPTTVAIAATAAISVSSLAVGLAHAGDAIPASEPKRAQLLYENHCITCHESTIHVRSNRAPNRKVLEGWVRRWHKVLNLNWNEHDIADVTDYLARAFYDFNE